MKIDGSNMQKINSKTVALVEPCFENDIRLTGHSITTFMLTKDQKTKG
jgi:hypothetical protein